jgi:hypothetical protein
MSPMRIVDHHDDHDQDDDEPLERGEQAPPGDR